MVKPGQKPATPTSAPTESIFSKMKKNARLNKHMAKAKTAIAVREFDGPDGDYTCKLARSGSGEKDGAIFSIFEFHIIDEGDYESQKIVIYTSFKDETVGLCRKLEQIQDEFMVMLQLMGIDTNIDDAALEKALNKIITDETPITVRMKSSVSKKDKNKTYKNASVVGVATLAKEVEDSEYEEVVEETVEEETVEEMEYTGDDVVPEETIEEEDWNEVEEEVIEEVAESAPSEWVGYALFYKETEYLVTDADDEHGKVILQHPTTKKKIKVDFSLCTPPAE
jgi:hypothetical protein